MSSTERKRLWRQRNPERSRQAERERAQARRLGNGSYYRYEYGLKRMMQRHWYYRLGAGAHRLSKEERTPLLAARKAERVEAFLVQVAAVYGEASAESARALFAQQSLDDRENLSELALAITGICENFTEVLAGLGEREIPLELAQP